MAVSTTEISGLDTADTPAGYSVPPALIFDLLSVHGFFDGSAAGGDFLPGIQIISDAGHTVSLTVGEKVTAGDSAEVTFGPFLKGAATATAGGGIQFNTEPQSGTFLYTQTTGADGTFGFGYVFDDPNENGSLFTGPVFGDSGSVGANTWSLGRGSGFRFRLLSGAASFGVSGVHGIITAFSNNASDFLSFFTAAPVAQQATPVTLADVIALLQAYGLSA